MKTDKKRATFTDVIQGDTPVLVDFYADWCGPCKMMQPILKEVKKHFGEKVLIIKIDVDRNQAVANRYQIRGVPTLILFKKGEILWRQSGVVQAGQLKSIIFSKISV